MGAFAFPGFHHAILPFFSAVLCWRRSRSHARYFGSHTVYEVTSSPPVAKFNRAQTRSLSSTKYSPVSSLISRALDVAIAEPRARSRDFFAPLLFSSSFLFSRIDAITIAHGISRTFVSTSALCCSGALPLSRRKRARFSKGHVCDTLEVSRLSLTSPFRGSYATS